MLRFLFLLFSFGKNNLHLYIHEDIFCSTSCAPTTLTACKGTVRQFKKHNFKYIKYFFCQHLLLVSKMVTRSDKPPCNYHLTLRLYPDFSSSIEYFRSLFLYSGPQLHVCGSDGVISDSSTKLFSPLKAIIRSLLITGQEKSTVGDPPYEQTYWATDTLH